MTRVSRTASTALSLLALGALIAACGASPTESTEQGSQALECITGDIAHPCVLPSPNPLPLPKTTCGVNLKGCPTSSPGPSFDPGGAGYDDMMIETSIPGSCRAITGLANTMIALGCGPETIFHDVDVKGDWAVAFCPAAVVPPEAPGEIIACDQCTGTPPAGWVVVAWPLNDPCGRPSGACAANGCRGI
jgi:hypothetical protein